MSWVLFYFWVRSGCAHLLAQGEFSAGAMCLSPGQGPHHGTHHPGIPSDGLVSCPGVVPICNPERGYYHNCIYNLIHRTLDMGMFTF